MTVDHIIFTELNLAMFFLNTILSSYIVSRLLTKYEMVKKYIKS